MMRPLLLWVASCLTLSAGEHRIACYSPGATQTLLDLGCSAEIVMATRWCPLPKAHTAARDADIFLPDLERLLNAKPDLVIIPRMANPLWADKCAKAGLRVVLLHPESRDSVSRDILLLGQATGRAETAKKIVDGFAPRPTAPARTIIMVWDGVMAGPDSYLAEPLAHAGLKSALNMGSWVRFDWELLAASNPDAVLWIKNSDANGPGRVSQEKIREMSRIPAIKDLPCLRQHRIYEATSGSNWLPGSGLSKISDTLISIREETEK